MTDEPARVDGVDAQGQPPPVARDAIVRPEGARPGRPAPWVDPAGVDCAIPAIEFALRDRRSAVVGTLEHRRTSAVLVVLYPRNGRTWLLLTRRSPTLRSHSAEVSFPGGLREPGDPDDWATALREAREEIGLDPSLPRRIGELDGFVTYTAQTLVRPLVAVLSSEPELRLNRAEVDRVIETPLDSLLDPAVFVEEFWPRIDGPERVVTLFELDGVTVWGVTAVILRQLLSIVAGVDDPIVR